MSVAGWVTACVCVCARARVHTHTHVASLCRELEERRIYVHVFKHLRVQQAKLDKDPVKQASHRCARATPTLSSCAATRELTFQ